MILSKAAIIAEIESGGITVYDQYDNVLRLEELKRRNMIGPNSIDLTFNGADVKMFWRGYQMTAGEDNSPCFKDLSPMPYKQKGRAYLFKAGHCYLASTNERISAPGCVMQMHGKSSRAREFLTVEQSAGLGDIGFDGTWTMEIVTSADVVVPVGIKICQIVFHRYEGIMVPEYLYNGRYVGQRGATIAKPEPSI